MNNYGIILMRSFALSLVVALLGFSAPNAEADIFQTLQNTTLDVNGTIYGQSFTADASVENLTNFLFVISNNAPGVTATAKLYAGPGYGGTLLDTETAFLSNIVPFNSPLTFNFSGNSLTNGNVYTVQVTSDAALDLQLSTSDPYSGGALLDAIGNPYAGGSADFKFIVEGTPLAVPEPTALAMLAGAAGTLLTRRRTSRLW